MFEQRVGSSRHEVAALLGDGFEVMDKRNVEDPDTGTLLVPAGGRASARPTARGLTSIGPASGKYRKAA